jgi:glycosyltransferase involved in cell wall biosynthesis
MSDARGRPYLSVVIAAYNEEQRLGDSLRRIGAYLRERGLDAEVLVVDDGSLDATQRIAREALREMRGRVVANAENRGKGYAVRRGALEASGRWVLFTDADLSTPIEEVEKLSAATRERDLDAAIGSRALPGSRVEERQSILRQSMGKTFNRVVRLATGLPFHDTQCGFKLLDRERLRPILQRMVVDGFAFDVELLYLCERFGLKVAEVPVVWRHAAGSKVGLVTDPVRMIADVARVLWRFRRGLYNPETDPQVSRADS